MNKYQILIKNNSIYKNKICITKKKIYKKENIPRVLKILKFT